ncbi:hypothetical protein HG530_013966 [Fusarium avenaceum]|nr:hypothetical protein HG530_013966 [Fusarium avenaceum]
MRNIHITTSIPSSAGTFVRLLHNLRCVELETLLAGGLLGCGSLIKNIFFTKVRIVVTLFESHSLLRLLRLLARKSFRASFSAVAFSCLDDFLLFFVFFTSASRFFTPSMSASSSISEMESLSRLLVDLRPFTFCHASRQVIKVSITSWSLSSAGSIVFCTLTLSRAGDVKMAK